VRSEADVVGRMAVLERQIVVFREEALRLFGVLGERERVVGELRGRVEELEGEKRFMDMRIKELMKENKEVKVRVAGLEGAGRTENVDEKIRK
jgi:hypothetical protein